MEKGERKFWKKAMKVPELIFVAKIQKPLSTETVQWLLRLKSCHGRIARKIKKPFISKINKGKKLEFAKQYLNWSENFEKMWYLVMSVVMVFGVVYVNLWSWNFCFVFIDTIMNKEMYLWPYWRLICKLLLPDWEFHGTIIYNNPKHTANIVRKTHRIVNPIENLWWIQKLRMKVRKSTSNALLLEKWNKISSEITKKIVCSMPRGSLAMGYIR